MNMTKKIESLFNDLHPTLGQQINGNAKVPLKGGEFLWASEADGMKHLAVHRADGTRRVQLTAGSRLMVDSTSKGMVDEAGGVVSAVCHGPCALTNVRLSNDEYLVAGKEVAAMRAAFLRRREGAIDVARFLERGR